MGPTCAPPFEPATRTWNHTESERTRGWGREKSRAAQDGGLFQGWAEAAEYSEGKHKMSPKWAGICATSLVVLRECSKQMWSEIQSHVWFRAALGAANWYSLSLSQNQMSYTLNKAKKGERNGRIYRPYCVNKNCAWAELMQCRLLLGLL